MVGVGRWRRWLSHGHTQWIESGLLDLWVNVLETKESNDFDYQSNISKRLIVKGLDNQSQTSKHLCLIIKSLDTQVQKLHNQINQYPPKSLTCYLETWSVSKSLKFILIDSKFGCHPVLSHLVTLCVSPFFTKIFLKVKISIWEKPSQGFPE